MKDLILQGDAFKVLRDFPDGSVDLVVTSPPYYGLRDYGLGKNALGNEVNPADYVRKLVTLFCGEVHRVLKDTGSMYLNLGDKYYCSQMGFHRSNIEKHQRSIHSHYEKMPALPAKADNYRQNKQLLQLPSAISLGLQKHNWILRNRLIWIKGVTFESSNGVANDAKDRFMNKSEEEILFFVKNSRYFFQKQEDLALRRGQFPGVKMSGSLIFCQRERYKSNHQGSFPEKLIEPFIRISSKPGGLVLDPFSGTGTVASVAKRLGRHFCGVELSKKFCSESRQRVDVTQYPSGAVLTVKRKRVAVSKSLSS